MAILPADRDLSVQAARPIRGHKKTPLPFPEAAFLHSTS
jgi:hypothetical protein